MKNYTLQKTNDKDLFRVVNRKGDWKFYYDRISKKYLKGITTILDEGYNKPELLIWAKNHSKEEIEAKLEKAGDKGDALHQFRCKFYENKGKVSRETKVLAEDNKTERTLTDEEWEAFLAFANFWQLHSPLIVAYEFAVKNLKYGFAGTGDDIWILRKKCEVKMCPCDGLIGKLGVWDLKTGGGIYPDYGPQLAAVCAGSIDRYIGKRKVDYTAILRIGTKHKTTGGYEAEIYDKKESAVHFREFLHAKGISDVVGAKFDPEKDIVEIPDEINLQVEFEKVKAKKQTKK